MQIKNIFGMKIMLARKTRGISQKDLAQKVGETQSNMSSYERGTRLPRADKAYRIAQELGVSVEWLFDESIFM